MKILLDTTNQTVLKIAHLACDRVGGEFSEEQDVDLVIKDVDSQIDTTQYDLDKTLFLVPKQGVEIAAKFKITKPFLPAELIGFLSSFGSVSGAVETELDVDFNKQRDELEVARNEKISQDILSLTQIVKEIDELNGDPCYDLKEPSTEPLAVFNDENLPHAKLEDRFEGVPKLEKLDVDDMNFVDILSSNLDSKDENLEDIALKFSEDSFADTPLKFEDKKDEKNLEDIALSLQSPDNDDFVEALDGYLEEYSDGARNLEDLANELEDEILIPVCEGNLSDKIESDGLNLAPKSEFSYNDGSDQIYQDEVLHSQDEEQNIKLQEEIYLSSELQISQIQNTQPINEPSEASEQKEELDASPVEPVSFDNSFVDAKQSNKKELKATIKEGLSENIAEFFSDTQMKEALKDMKIKIKISFEDR